MVWIEGHMHTDSISWSYLLASKKVKSDVSLPIYKVEPKLAAKSESLFNFFHFYEWFKQAK